MSETQAPPQSGMGVIQNPPPQFASEPPPVAPPPAPAPAVPPAPDVPQQMATGGFMDLDPAQIARAAAFLKAAQTVPGAQTVPPPPEPAADAKGKDLAEQLKAQLAAAQAELNQVRAMQAEQAARTQFASAAGQYRFRNTAVQDLAFRHFQANYDVDSASGAIRNKATGQFFFKDNAGTLGTLPDLIQHLAQGELAPLFDTGPGNAQAPAAGIGHISGGAPAGDPYNWTPHETWLDDHRNMRALVATGQKDRWVRTRTIDRTAVEAFLAKLA